jgi:hypothetical protein
VRRFETGLSPALRRVYAGRTDPHRISGSGFSSLADVSFSGQHEVKKISAIRQASVVFVNADCMGEFTEAHSRKSSPRVIILGNSDRDWTSFDYKLPRTVKRVFLQNSLIPNDKRFVCLPIGIENIELGRNGLPHLFGTSYQNRLKHQLTMLGPFGSTHPSRQEILETDYSQFSSITVFRDRMSSIETAWRSSHHAFIAAPRGNGKDTHRFWEALYRGSLPAVEDDVWADNMESIGVPLVRTSGWTGTNLEDATRGRQRTFKVDEVAALNWDYWRAQIKDCV